MFNNTISINKKKIGINYPPYIVAEISANHNGNLQNALNIIKKAKQSGADAIKIQTYTPDTMTIDSRKKDFHISKGLWKDLYLYQLYKKAYTPYEWHEKIFKYCKKINITCFSTPFDETAVDLLSKFDPPAYKIASFEMTDIPLIEYIINKNKNKPIIVSTGMATLEEINETVGLFKKKDAKNLILLHCVSAYPALSSDYNLKTIPDLRKRYNVCVGLSDHTINNTVAISSVPLGSIIIEKHFTLDRKLKSPDSQFSLEPHEFESLVKEVRESWLAMGKVNYKPLRNEKESIKYRRSIYAVKKIKKDEVFNKENIRRIRPGYGLPPKFYQKILGLKASKNIGIGTAITKKIIKGN